jgi:hypothetical protein
MKRYCLILAALLAVARPAAASPYEVFVDVETEEDLYDLLASQQISDETFEILLDLFQRGIDLDTASREELYTLPNLTYGDVDGILAYRAEVGHIVNPSDLVANGVLTEDKLLGVAAFLVVRTPGQAPFATAGWVRLQTRWSAEDDQAPPFGLRARITTAKHLTLGVAATTTRNRLGEVVYDPNRDALVADLPTYQVHVPKAFARWETDQLVAIGGTYRIGFGQRLTFDNSSDYTPNGIYIDDKLTRDDALTRACKESQGELDASPCSGAAGDVYITPDFKWSAALLGVAVGLKHVEVGQGWAQAYAWGSYQPKSIYQYELYDRGRCEDPHADDDPACAAPGVYVRRDDPLEPTSRFSFQTLPSMFVETVAGANATYYASRRASVGVTGYAATTKWLTRGIELDAQEWSRQPSGGGFGAAGVNVAFGHDWLDVFAEATHSFDSVVGAEGGAPAVVARATATWKKKELEASFRWFDDGFVNPYARPIAAADEFEGQRARDEVGGRLRYTGKHGKQLNLRAAIDLWYTPSDGASKMLGYVRTDVDVTRQLRWGVWAQYQDKDLAEGGRGECFEVSTEFDENGEPIPCAGQKLQLTGRLRWAPEKSWNLSGQLQGELVDDGKYPDAYRKDLSAWVIATVKPAERVRVRARARYLTEDIADSASLEESLWTYVDFTYRLRRRDNLRLRYDLFIWLDDRDSTQERSPNPEHWLWAEYEAKF